MSRRTPRGSAPAVASILSTGSYLPERVLTNSELAGMVETSDEWIRSHIGIGERRIPPGEFTSEMAVHFAMGLIRSGSARRLLVIGAERMSRLVDWRYRATCVIFADGAGAAVTRDIPPRVVAVGVPARVIRERGLFTPVADAESASRVRRGEEDRRGET